LDSNKIDKNNSQSEKHDDPRLSGFRGISIDPSDEHPNASGSCEMTRPGAMRRPACPSDKWQPGYSSSKPALHRCGIIKSFRWDYYREDVQRTPYWEQNGDSSQ
jgi:hypothetical protein